MPDVYALHLTTYSHVFIHWDDGIAWVGCVVGWVNARLVAVARHLAVMDALFLDVFETAVRPPKAPVDRDL